MVHGTDKKKKFFHQIERDISEASHYYPWLTCQHVRSPSAKDMTAAVISVIAVNKDIINQTECSKEDCISEYSHQIILYADENYQTNGCTVFGGQWIKPKLIPFEEQHWYKNMALKDGTKCLCIGIPQSFADQRNVILESIKTAENLLTYYQILQEGKTPPAKLIQYSHGDLGIYEYRK